MKKIFCFIIFLIFVICSFVGCNLPQQTTPKTKTKIVDNSKIDSITKKQEFLNYIEEKNIDKIQEIFIEPFSSAVYSEDWNTPTEIKDFLLVDMYREFLFDRYDENNSLPQSYHYSEGGFIYPQKEFESFIQQHFELSSDFLRKNNFWYDKDLESYLFQGGGIGRKDYLIIKDENDINYENNILTINADYQFYAGDKTIVESEKELTIEITEDGEFFYKSYKTINNFL